MNELKSKKNSVNLKGWHIAAAQKLLNEHYKLSITRVYSTYVLGAMEQENIEDMVTYNLRHSEDEMATKIARVIAETEAELKLRGPSNVPNVAKNS
jgi:hypothetical protein